MTRRCHYLQASGGDIRDSRSARDSVPLWKGALLNLGGVGFVLLVYSISRKKGDSRPDRITRAGSGLSRSVPTHNLKDEGAARRENPMPFRL